MSGRGRSPLPASLWFTAEHLADFDDQGAERKIVEGRLIEYPLSERGYLHSRVTARLGQILGNRRDQQPEPHGDVLVGDAAFRPRRNPHTAVGVDVTYISPAQRAGAILDTFALEGPPLPAVEI